MPEALAVLAVFLVCVVVFFQARAQANDPAQRNSSADLVQLNAQVAWLRTRLHLAEKENWGGEMTRNIAAELERKTRALAKATAEVSE